MIFTMCWFAFGLGRGAEALRVRFFSRPPLPVEYCQAFIAEGKVDAIVGRGYAWIWTLLMFVVSHYL